MWLSKNLRGGDSGGGAELGVTTIPGEHVGVLTRGEKRDVPVYSPGGFVWLPCAGDSVLVVKGGPGGEERCVCGKKQSAVPAGMQPGEAYLCSGGASCWLKNDGSIELRGNVKIAGALSVNGQPYHAGQTTSTN